MSLQKIQDILYNSIGLHVETIGSSTILHAVNERISSCKSTNIESYYEKLLADNNELKELIEEVVIPETWFFRDNEPFKMLLKFVQQEWLTSNPISPLRILSIPCATGEEPYSIAMTLLDAGLTPSQVYIDAIDVSDKNIKRCKEARYREHSFRGVDPLSKKRFFRLHNNGLYYPDILIKAMVNFKQASLLDAHYIYSQLPYDVVFCRNLLIYFDDKTQQTAASMLKRLVKRTGILFVGHAETGRFINSETWKTSQKYPKSFALRKFNDDPNHKEITSRTISARSKVKAAKLFKTKKITHSKKSPIKAIPKKETSIEKEKVTSPNLKQAQKLADEGSFIEAESICLSSLSINKQDSKAYFLLAFIQMATGNEHKAVEYFRNVIYLEPRNYDALMYLSTLIGQQGDQKQAQNLRERAQRCQR